MCWDISGEGTSAELTQCVWGAESCRVSLLLLHPNPAGRHSGHPQDVPLTAALPQPPTLFTTCWHNTVITCCSTLVCDAHIDSRQYCAHILSFLLSLSFFLSEDILRVNDNVLLRLQSRANFFRELGSKFHKTKKTCCCCRWGCMQYNWCTFLVWGVWISFNCHHFGRSSKKKAIYIFIWGRCGSELCACTAMRNPFATSQSRCITSLVAPY